MKKITLLIALLVTSMITAQTTFTIFWELSPSNTNLTINQGDTVIWEWVDGLTHTVTNIAGSQENFDSGNLTGIGETFSFTFAEIGSNPYQCDIHPGSMNGTITVEQSLGVDEVFLKNIQLFPNPVNNELTVFSLFKLASYTVHDFAGRRVVSGLGEDNFTSVDMATLPSGVYFVTLTSEDGLQATKKIVKK